MRLLFASDLHGRNAFYDELWRVAASYDGVILGGDLLPNIGGLDWWPQRQALERLLERIHTFRSAHPETEFYLMLGNDDWGANQDLLESSEDVHAIEGRVIPLNEGWNLCAYGYVNPTPFQLKDWEKWDREVEEVGRFIRRGYRSVRGHIRPFLLDGTYRETIADDLEALAKQIPDFRRTLCVMHAPPHDTPLDQLASGEHVGSRAIRGFIERYQPALTLHGHIHESPRCSGSWVARIGRTLSVNPGQGRRWHYVSIQLAPLEVAHSIYGSL